MNNKLYLTFIGYMLWDTIKTLLVGFGILSEKWFAAILASIIFIFLVIDYIRSKRNGH